MMTESDVLLFNRPVYEHSDFDQQLLYPQVYFFEATKPETAEECLSWWARQEEVVRLALVEFFKHVPPVTTDQPSPKWNLYVIAPVPKKLLEHEKPEWVADECVPEIREAALVQQMHRIGFHDRDKRREIGLGRCYYEGCP